MIQTTLSTKERKILKATALSLRKKGKQEAGKLKYQSQKTNKAHFVDVLGTSGNSDHAIEASSVTGMSSVKPR
jgi:hypothetical protein